MDSKHPIALADLPAAWRSRADWLHELGASDAARSWRTAAREVEEALQAFGDETFSLTQAAKLSGFTADHLSALVKRGRIPNAGREGAPRIRRVDLPVKRAGGPGRPSRSRTPPAAVDAEREHFRRIAQSFTAKERR